MKSLLLFVFALFVVQVLASCSEYAHCASCSSASSWLGTCRWCPKDQRCHAFGSLMNACSADENIKNPLYCPPVHKQTDFNLNLAHTMLQYCSATTHSQPSHVIPSTATILGKWLFPVGTTQSFGFIAIDETQKQIVVAFRGTVGVKQLMYEVLNTEGVPYPGAPGLTIYKYFYSAWYPFVQPMTAMLSEQRKEHPEFTVMVTGHSLGGALASLMAFEIARTNIATPILYTFGQPRTGDIAYANAHNKAVPKAYRVVNNRDPVPHVNLCLPSHTKQECTFHFTESQPWHHGTEMFFGAGDYRDNIMCGYRECLRQPFGEDHACADGFINMPVSVFEPGLSKLQRIGIITAWGVDLVLQHTRDYWLALDNGFCGVKA